MFHVQKNGCGSGTRGTGGGGGCGCSVVVVVVVVVVAIFNFPAATCGGGVVGSFVTASTFEVKGVSPFLQHLCSTSCVRN